MGGYNHRRHHNSHTGTFAGATPLLVFPVLVVGVVVLIFVSRTESGSRALEKVGLKESESDITLNEIVGSPIQSGKRFFPTKFSDWKVQHFLVLGVILYAVRNIWKIIYRIHDYYDIAKKRVSGGLDVVTMITRKLGLDFSSSSIDLQKVRSEVRVSREKLLDSINDKTVLDKEGGIEVREFLVALQGLGKFARIVAQDYNFRNLGGEKVDPEELSGKIDANTAGVAEILKRVDSAAGKHNGAKWYWKGVYINRALVEDYLYEVIKEAAGVDLELKNGGLTLVERLMNYSRKVVVDSDVTNSTKYSKRYKELWESLDAKLGRVEPSLTTVEGLNSNIDKKLLSVLPPPGDHSGERPPPLEGQLVRGNTG